MGAIQRNLGCRMALPSKASTAVARLPPPLEPWENNAFARWTRASTRRKIQLRSTASLTMKSILDPSFRYTNSDATDIRKTFARIRREMRRRPLETVPTPKAITATVLSLPRRRSTGR